MKLISNAIQKLQEKDIKDIEKKKLKVNHIVITRYENEPKAKEFKKLLEDKDMLKGQAKKDFRIWYNNIKRFALLM